VSRNNGHGEPPDRDAFQSERLEMVARQIRDRGILAPRVLAAMQTVPRHLFVPSESAGFAYADEPLPIGQGQTISQPYIVAAMSAALHLEGHERVLEVGAGSGYQAAVLSLLAREVIAIESLPPLAAAARERLERLGFLNVRVVEADGTLGFPEAAPFDGILVTAAAPSVPPPLLDQLAEGGRLIIPVGDPEFQTLFRISKSAGRVKEEPLFTCRFVPLLGRYGWGGSRQETSSK
jgi:protein-L-isoaspartate(D-aspartate) O-methyltransferase